MPIAAVSHHIYAILKNTNRIILKILNNNEKNRHARQTNHHRWSSSQTAQVVKQSAPTASRRYFNETFIKIILKLT